MKSEAIISCKEIYIKGIATHNKAQSILYNLREYIEEKNRVINISFEGSPGPFGEGICIKITISGKHLDRTDIKAIAKFFKIIGVKVTVLED